jgi:hypothetical protein
MEDDILFIQRQLTCAHKKQVQYQQRQFDILNGLEYHFTRCLNCHKIVDLEAKKIFE